MLKLPPLSTNDSANGNAVGLCRRAVADRRRKLQYLKRVLRRLGLPGHLHTFRHSFISHALTKGTPEAIVRQWVGHVDAEILRWYAHIADSASHDAMRRLAESGNGCVDARDAAQNGAEAGPQSAQSQHNTSEEEPDGDAN